MTIRVHVCLFMCSYMYVYISVSVDVISYLLVIPQKPHTLFVFIQSFTELGALISQSWLPLSFRDPLCLDFRVDAHDLG